MTLVHTEAAMSALPGEGWPLSCIKGVSELFHSIVLTREAEDSLLVQAVLFNELHTLLHQDWHRVRPKTLLICYCVHETLSKNCREVRHDIVHNSDEQTLLPFSRGVLSHC